MTDAHNDTALSVAHDRGVVTVTLNRPRQLNALNAHLMDGLRGTWRTLAADRSVRCVIVTGAGRAFCAGADMELLASDRADAATSWEEELSFLPGDQLEVPVIAAVNGPCVGAGLHFVADADIALAARSAIFSDPHVSVGQVSALEPLILLSQVRTDVVRRMVLLGRAEVLDGERALAAGLVSELVDDDALAARARALAGAICAGSPAAIAASRRVMRAQQHQAHGELLTLGWSAIQAHWAHPDAHEGPAAFSARRDPRWTTLGLRPERRQRSGPRT